MKAFKKVLALVLSSVMVVSLFACAAPKQEVPKQEAAAQTEAAAPAVEKLTLRVGFENSMSEPVGQGVQKWADLVKEKSGGNIELLLYPDSQLGAKNDLIDQMLFEENVCTLADGAFYADYGVPDFGIVFGPFLFDNWDQCWKLTESSWYADQCKKLEGKGLKLLASNWAYGLRHTMTVDPVNKVEDLNGMKIRVPNNKIQSLGFDVLGASSVGMALGDVYGALQSKTIDGAENPLATLYGRKLQEVAKNIILDGHVYNFTTWVCSNSWFNKLTPEQQNILTSCAKEAGIHNNNVLAAVESDYIDKFKAEGCTIVEPSAEVLNGFKEKSKAFYDHGADFEWSDGLYDTVCKAMGK